MWYIDHFRVTGSRLAIGSGYITMRAMTLLFVTCMKTRDKRAELKGYADDAFVSKIMVLSKIFLM